MALRQTRISGQEFETALTALRSDLHVPDAFPADVLGEAEAAAGRALDADRHDARDLELVTLDPRGSTDLDQAFAIEPVGDGFRFIYAIADVGWFVAPGGLVDQTAHERGMTEYLPDGRVPLHPPVLSEGAASLLPGQDRPAVLWQLQLDGRAEPTSVEVRRAVVRSRTQLAYDSFEADGGEVVESLRRLGTLRMDRERERGGVSLPTPEQEVVGDAATGWSLQLRAPVPAEDWNAQLSLLTGMAAASLMVEAKVGLLRVMPAPPGPVIDSLRRSAAGLGIAWPADASYQTVLRGLDPAVPAHAAMLRVAATLFRGAHYVAFDGSLPDLTTHSAVAAQYAHATAPLRRLADRFVSEVCLAISAGVAVPGWARDGLAALPAVMAAADQRSHQIDRAVIDLAEALVLQRRIGETFGAVVIDVHHDHGQVQLSDPPVRAPVDGADLPLGQQIQVKLVAADPATRTVRFERA